MMLQLVVMAFSMTPTFGNFTVNYGNASSGGGNFKAVNNTPGTPYQRTTVASSLCGGTLYGSGYIRSPNYPATYDNNLRCNWTIYASPYYGNIVIQFSALTTEQFYDIVSIYNSSGALVNQYSGTSVPATTVLSSTAVITFTTDASVVFSGFSLWFSTSVSATTLSPRDSCERQGNFYCAPSYICVPMSQRCNGYSYCNYGEDEAGCISTTPTRTVTTPSPRDSCERQGYFYCTLSNQCVPMSQRCNGYFYCYYGEDEAGCGTTTPTRTASTTLSMRESCLRRGNFYCEYSQLCISFWRRCDNYPDCYYGEDESGCGTSATTPGQYSRTTSDKPLESFFSASGFAQAFLHLRNAAPRELLRGSWVVAFSCVAALFLSLQNMILH